MAKIAVFGGTGYAGGNIAREAAARGHSVTSYTRNPPVDPNPAITFEVGSLHDQALVQKVAADADVIVISVHGHYPEGPQLIEAVPSLIDAAISAGTRLGVVGGAGSTQTSEDGPRLIDLPDFPAEYKPEAQAMADVLDALRDSPEALDWFYISPGMLFGAHAPGETTGTYRTGTDVMVTKDDGSSAISGTDYALAFVDEIDQPKHPRQRFTVGN
jgi:putative NADH-flavin reductase